MTRSHLPMLRRFWRLLPLIALAALISGASAGAANLKKDYKSRFGVMGLGPDGKYHVFAETTQIHRLVDETYVHGFEVVRKDGSRFMGGFEVRFPEPIKVTPEIEKAFTVKEGGRVLQSLSEIRWGTYSAPFWFSEDDPLGTYSITIFIDGQEYRTIQYEVMPFGDEPITF